MLKNHLKVAWRNLVRNKFSTFVNIGGLAVGMAVAILIGLWIHDEFSFNKSFRNYDRLGRVMVKWDGALRVGSSLPMPLGMEIRNDFKDDFANVILAMQTGSHIITSGERKFTQPGTYMQPEAPEMFSLNMIKGSRKGLQTMHSIMINLSLAKKLFGDEDPINKVVRMDNKDNVQVTGVYEDFPANNDFHEISFIAPWDLNASNEWMKGRETQWNNNFLYIYAQLAPNADFDKVSAKIKDIKLAHAEKEEAAAKPNVFVHPMSKWHLYSQFGVGGVSETSEQMKFIRFYATIGFFVLLLACINFMNLSTAKSEKRAKEVGIRKAIGSRRRQLITQFFGEALLVSFFSFGLSILMVVLLLPWFNAVSGKQISVLWGKPLFWLTGICFTAITGLVAGSYPALYLSSFNAVKVLKGTFRVGRLASVPRKLLVVLQFTVSVSLIIGTIVVYRQIQFAKNRPVGYNREGLLMIPMASADFYDKYDLLKTQLKRTGMVMETAESLGPVTGIWSENGGFDWKGKDPMMNKNFATLPVTQEFGKTIGWQFIDGRDFMKGYASDSSGFVINESAAKLMGLKNPVGEIVHVDNYWLKNENFRILGVVKDMVMNSPFEPASPTIFFLKPEGSMNRFFVKINPNISAAKALPKIERVFKQLIPAAPFEYSFADEQYAAKFAEEERIGILASFFAVLAVFISCLGLFGLASFVAAQRTKEIGVRKVLGASIFAVWKLLSKDFVQLIIISCLIAIPLAGYFMSEWLSKYEYRTRISWWIFAAAILGALLITLLTISYQAIKAALANPVDSLRTE